MCTHNSNEAHNKSINGDRKKRVALFQTLEGNKALVISRDIIAIVCAVILFTALHYVLTISVSDLSENNQNFSKWLPWLNVLAYILYIITGMVASLMAANHTTVVGTAAGLSAAVIAIFIFGVGGDIIGIIFTLLWGLVLGSLGGKLSAFAHKYHAKSL